MDRPRVTFWILAIGVCSYSLLQSMTVPALPRIQAELHTDQASAAWVLTAFLVSASVATPIVGRLGDSYGKKRLLVFSLGALVVGSLAAAAAPTIGLMILARVVQGIGGGALPLSFGIIRDELPPERIPGSISLISSLLAVGFGAGIVVTGPIIDLLGYHWLFLLPALAAGAGALATYRFVPESAARSRRPVRLIPAILLAGWLVVLLVGVTKAPTWGWGSIETMVVLAIGAMLLVAWGLIEWRIDVPLIDLRLMATRPVASPNLVALLIGVAMYGSFGFMPQFNQTPPENGYGFGASVAQAGHIMLPAAALSFVSGVFSARLARRVGARRVVTFGCLVTAGGLLVTVFAHDHLWQMYVSSGVSGLGTGLAFACLANVVVAAVPRHSTGVATGMNANIRTIGGAVGSAVLITLVTANVLPSGYPTEHGYEVGFLFLAGAALLAGLAGLLIPRPTAKPVPIPATLEPALAAPCPPMRSG